MWDEIFEKNWWFLAILAQKWRNISFFAPKNRFVRYFALFLPKKHPKNPRFDICILTWVLAIFDFGVYFDMGPADFGVYFDMTPPSLQPNHTYDRPFWGPEAHLLPHFPLFMHIVKKGWVMS